MESDTKTRMCMSWLPTSLLNALQYRTGHRTLPPLHTSPLKTAGQSFWYVSSLWLGI